MSWRWLPGLALAGFLSMPLAAHAQVEGPEFQVNTYTAGNQLTQPRAVASDASGGFVVVWTSHEGQDGSGSGVFGQRYASSGGKLGPEFRVNAHTTGDQGVASVASLGEGRFVVVWSSDGQDGSGSGVFGQRYASNGNPQGTEFRVNVETAGGQEQASVAGNAAGEFVVAWVSPDPDASGIFARRYDRGGDPVGGEIPVNTHTTGDQALPSVALAEDGRFVVAWSSAAQDGSDFGVFAQRFDASGNPVGLELPVNTFTAGTQSIPSVASDPTGGFVVVWHSDGQDGSGFGVFGRRYDQAGMPRGGEFRVNTRTADQQGGASVASEASGEFVVTWSSTGQDGDSVGVFGQRYDRGGGRVGDEFQVNTHTADIQANASVASDGRGDLVVVWSSYGQDGDQFGVFGQRYRAPSLSLGDASAIEGNAGAVPAVFTVSLSGPVSHPVSVAYAATGGSASADSDFTPVRGTVIFPPGITSRTINVPVLGDTEAETAEAFFVDLSSPSWATIDQSTGQGTITDNDVSGSLQFSGGSYSASEAAPFATITVKRTGGAASGVTVDYEASDGTAREGSDYAAASGALSFGAGATMQSFQVPILNDTAHDPEESLLLRLSNAGGLGAIVALPETAVLTITDNDVAGKVQLGAASYSGLEGTSLTVTVRRVGGTASGATVEYATSHATASDADYTPASGTLTFGPGELSKTFNVDLALDSRAEGNETLNVILGNPSGGLTAGAPLAATMTILDAQSAVSFASGATSVNETAASLVLTVNRAGPPTGTVTVSYSTADGSARAGEDYTSTSGTLTFLPNVRTRTILVPLKPDTVADGSENFTVTLSGPTGAGLGSPASTTVTIVENDLGGRLQFGAASYNASEPLGTAPTKATIAVKRTSGLASGVEVHYSTSNGGASAGVDYEAASGTLSFGAGQAVKTFTVDLLPDASPEGNETVVLSLDSPTGGASLGTPSIIDLNILDNEPVLQFGAVTYLGAEKPTGSSVLVTVKRTGSTAGDATVHYAASGGSAVNGTDYALAPGTLTFPSRTTVQTVTVPILYNDEPEERETAILELSAPSGAGLGPQKTALLAITDFEPAFQLSADRYTAAEPAASVGKLTLTVKRTGAPTLPAEVAYATSNGTAKAGEDYAGTTGTLSFLPGQVSKIVTLDILPDTVDEPIEAFTFGLDNARGATLGTPKAAVVSIGDNDVAGTVQLGAASYSVGEGAGLATVTVTRTGGTSSEATVAYLTGDDTARAGSDYDAASGTVTFGLGETTRTFTVTIRDDLVREGNETVKVALQDPGNGLFLGARKTALLWIVDDEATTIQESRPLTGRVVESPPGSRMDLRPLPLSSSRRGGNLGFSASRPRGP
jgi:hypothetical protein